MPLAFVVVRSEPDDVVSVTVAPETGAPEELSTRPEITSPDSVGWML